MLQIKKGILIVLLVLIGPLSGMAWAAEVDLIPGGQEQQTLYFRREEGVRYLDSAPGSQLVEDNVSSFIRFWGGYHFDHPFELNTFDMELHLDVSIDQVTSSSRIVVAMMRNGNVVFSSTVWEMPQGMVGPRQVDIIAQEHFFPGVTFNQGDEIAFFFQQTSNLDPCTFRYNGPGSRDNSHLTIHLDGTDYPVVELVPSGIDLSLDPGGSADTVCGITNLGAGRMHYDLDLPQEQQILSYNDGDDPAIDWIISDQFGQDYFNVRFTPAQDCTLRSAQLLLSPDSTQGQPDLMIYVWDDVGGLPGMKLDSVLVPNSSLVFHPSWQAVYFTGEGLLMSAHQDFHIGYTAISNSPGDALAIYSDEGQPVGNERRSSGKWGDNWRTVYDRYGVDANFMIQATVKYGTPPSWLDHGSPPGSLAPLTTHQIPVTINSSGLSDGIYKSGVIIENDSPDRSIVFPVVLRVGQTGVDDGREGVLPKGHGLLGSYPNPFNAETSIRYQVGAPGEGPSPVSLIIYNIAGQRIRRLVDGMQPSGTYQVHWDGTDDAGRPAASGLYFCRMEAGPYRGVRKIVLLK
jgi:hypothetical protein